MSLYNNGKHIIVLREGQISPYIEIISQPHVNYIKEDGIYLIFLEEYNDFVA